MPFTLRVSQDGESDAFAFETGEARLGRTADNDIIIKDPASSRSHARIYETQGHYFVEDLRSANGTQLNGQPLSVPTPLRNGDRITIGDTELTFEAGAAAAPASTMPGDDPSATSDASVTGESAEPEDAIAPGDTGEPLDGSEPGSTAGRARPVPLGSRTLSGSDPALVPQPASTLAELDEVRPTGPKPKVDPHATELRPRSSRVMRKPPPGPAQTTDLDDEPSAVSSVDPEDVLERARATRQIKALALKAPLGRPAAVNPSRASRAEPVTPPASLAPADATAAERARQRRALEKSTLGKMVVLFGELSAQMKVVVGTLLTALAVTVLGIGVWLVLPKRVEAKVEPVTLAPNGEAIEQSFGVGDDVDFTNVDMKAFTFAYPSATPIVGVLHYQAQNCSKDEISVELNGEAIDSVPADTVDAVSRQLELVLPSSRLQVGTPNELVFDNTANPPANETWKVWNVWVEIIPVPALTSDQAAQRVKESIARATQDEELRDVGAINLFRAWKTYRDAWLLLEATPDHSAELLTVARTRMQALRPELDRKCSAMLVNYQKEMNRKQPNTAKARKVLQNIPEHFEKEHWCFGASRMLLRELDDFE